MEQIRQATVPPGEPGTPPREPVLPPSEPAPGAPEPLLPPAEPLNGMHRRKKTASGEAG